MKLNKFLLLNFVFLLFVSATCKSGTSSDNNSSSDLPEQYDKLSIRWFNGGGMVNMGERIFLGQDSGKWEFSKNGHEQTIEFKVRESELKELYNFIREQEFDKIQAQSKGKVYDRGGTSIELTVNGERYSIDNSGNTFIDEDWMNNWRAISAKIQSFANSKVDEKRFDCLIKLDESIVDSPYLVNLSVNGPLILNAKEETPTKEDFKTGKSVRLIPGENEFDIYLFYPDSTSNYGGKVKYKSAYLWEDIQPVNKSVELFLNGEEIDVRIE